MRILSLIVITAAYLFSAAVAVAAIADVKSLNNGAPVSVAGTIERIDSARRFVLRDSSGTIRVNVAAEKPVTLTNGMYVTVGGTVDQGLFSTTIDANNVTTHKTLEGANKSVAKSAALATNGAVATTIAKLPAAGMVKLSGVVLSVDNERQFSLQDATGTVNVDIEADEYVSLTPGTQVIVVGYVDSRFLARDINATKVSVVADVKDGTTTGR